MVGRVYYGPLNAIAVTATANRDLWTIATAATNKAIILGWEVTSSSTSAEALTMRVLRGSGAPTGGTTPTVEPANDDDAANTVTFTAYATPGTDADVLQHFTWEQIGPLAQWYIPEARIVVPESSYLKLNMVTQPTAYTLNGYVCWMEI